MNKLYSFISPILATLLFVTILFSPFFFAFSACNEDLSMRLLVNFLYLVIVWIVLIICQGKLRKVLALCVAVISFAPNVIVQSFILMDNYILKSTDFWVVFNTNATEAINLFSILPFSVYFFGLLYVILLILSLILLFATCNQNSLHHYIQFVAIFILLLISIVNPFRSKVSTIDFYKSIYKYQREMNEVADFYRQRQNIHLNVDCSLANGNKTFLIIIGESQNRKHMQLYGYARQTNPMLTNIYNELICFRDVCSPAIQTLACMKQILSFANYETPDLYKQEANIIEILRSAGYKTFWYDNQGVTGNGLFDIDTYTPTSYRTMARQSDVYDDAKSAERDSALIPQLEVALQDTSECKVIFLHLVGNHFEYRTRYEQGFKVFNTFDGIVSPISASLTSQQLECINDYDNATRYNDYIISTCIDLLRKQEGMSAMLYFSDHGEEVFDCQNYMTRSFEKISPVMCEIPLILWMNEEYYKQSKLCIDENLPICTDDIIHGIMDLTGSRYILYDAKRSIFNPLYKPKERMVQGVSYQSICDKFTN